MSKQTVGMENAEPLDKRELYETVWQTNDTWDIWGYRHTPDFQTKKLMAGRN